MLRAGAIASLLCLCAGARAGEPGSGWGVDACIAAHSPPADVDGYIDMLRAACLSYVRERSPGDVLDPGKSAYGLGVFAKLRAAGLRIDAFAELPGLPPPEHPWQDCTTDLMKVYQSARSLGSKTLGQVDAWELGNEPDAWFSKESPDRFMAIQKAAYLGIKDGAREALAKWQSRASSAKGSAQAAPPSVPGVLMAALAHAPGPWLARAAKNGIYDYTDAVNIHYYGHARDLAGFIRAHRRMAGDSLGGAALPIWITECGMDALPYDDPDDAYARNLQREFTIETSQTAIAEKVAVFMQFIFVTRPPWGGHALVKTPGVAFPAWTAYRDFTRKNALPRQPALRPPPAPARVVLQWRADYETCVPQKVSGTYWFQPSAKVPATISGELAAYNFSDKPASGELVFQKPRGVKMLVDKGEAGSGLRLDIPPMSARKIPMAFVLESPGYVRSDVAVRFEPQGAASPSRLAFGVETRPEDRLLSRRFPLEGARPGEDSFEWIWAPEPVRVSDKVGPWLAVNGVKVTPPPGAGGSDLGRVWSFELTEKQKDPRFPPMAVTKVNGLPAVEDGFLRVRPAPDTILSNAFRVDLIDKRGQRFSIAENFGQNRFRPNWRKAFLAYKDFHLYAWGRCTDEPRFRPEDIREIQLRFYASPDDPSAVQARLDVVAPGRP